MLDVWYSERRRLSLEPSGELGKQTNFLTVFILEHRLSHTSLTYTTCCIVADSARVQPLPHRSPHRYLPVSHSRSTVRLSDKLKMDKVGLRFASVCIVHDMLCACRDGSVTLALAKVGCEAALERMVATFSADDAQLTAIASAALKRLRSNLHESLGRGLSS